MGESDIENPTRKDRAEASTRRSWKYSPHSHRDATAPRKLFSRCVFLNGLPDGDLTAGSIRCTARQCRRSSIRRRSRRTCGACFSRAALSAAGTPRTSSSKTGASTARRSSKPSHSAALHAAPLLADRAHGREQRADAPHRPHSAPIRSCRDTERHQSGGGHRGHCCRLHFPRAVGLHRQISNLRQSQWDCCRISNLIRDALAGRAARVFREAVGRGCSKPELCVQRPAGGPTWRISRLKGFRLRLRSDAEGGLQMDVPSGRIGRPTISAYVRTVAAAVGARAFWSRTRRAGGPAPNDETHHRLPDGTTLHVSIWNMPEEKRRSGFAACAAAERRLTKWLVGSNAQ